MDALSAFKIQYIVYQLGAALQIQFINPPNAFGSLINS